MPYFIGEPCIDTMDRSCMDECPVDCIYEGEHKLYINPVECIDCGACELACPVEAISSTLRPAAGQQQYVVDNAAFFAEVLPGRQEALGNPGGSGRAGPIGADTPLVSTVAGSR
jgi:NAD-dependent dihydropyrimidine dehydrogenase PreA subunit